MKQKKWVSLILFFLLCFGVAFAGSLATKTSVDTWYRELDKPSWTPPSWVFAPAWTVLYALIAVSGWLVYEAKRDFRRKRCLYWYGAQLFFNFIWSFLFFYFRSPLLGSIDIAALLVAIGGYMAVSWNLSKTAFLLFVPYLIWVLYAASLNFSIFAFN